MRAWIGNASAARVGLVWRAEDHAALIRNLQACDRLAEQLVAFARKAEPVAGKRCAGAAKVSARDGGEVAA